MRFDIDLYDLILTLVFSSITTFFFLFTKQHIKFYRTLIDPIRIVKQDIKMDKFFIVVFFIFMLYSYYSDINFYNQFAKDLGKPFTIRFFPIFYLYTGIIYLYSNKRNLKQLEEDKANKENQASTIE